MQLKFKVPSVRWCVVLGGFLCARAWAGVVVTENVSPGATSWPGTPVISTVSNPAGQVAVVESFNSNGATNYSETFTIASSGTLQGIDIYAGQGSGTGTGTNLTLRLFDLGSQTAPNPSAYTPGSDLFNSGSGLPITYTTQATGVLEFSFTGSDQAALQAGHMYAFEIDGVLNTQPILFERTTTDTYSGGAAYRNRSWINGTSGRDFAMAVYASGGTNSTTTNIFWGPNGDLFHGFNAPVSGINQDGANPAAGLALSGNVLCGTTLDGGAQGAGTLFYVTLDGTNFNAFHSFANAPDAGNPMGELSVSGNGFFGTTFGGGSSGVGSVFAGQTNGTASVVRSFSAVSADNATNSGGASPSALIAQAGNTIYGTTTAGGAAANGTVFSVATNGGTFTVLHNFGFLDSQAGTNIDGAVPWGGLVLSGNVLYGTASVGGAGGSGVIFSVVTNGANFNVLYNFSPLDTQTATNADGAIPFGGLVLSNATLYGTSYAGGQNARGTIFSIQTNGSGFTVLHQFAATDPVTGTNSDGASSCGTLILSGNVLYGAAASGGAGAAGTVFSVNTINGQFTALHSFAGLASSGTNVDGAFPVAPVLRVGNSLYGTAFGGGPEGAGAVFVVAIPPAAAVITNIAQNVDGSVTLFFLGGPNSTNVIQSATDLTPPIAWQNVSTNVADANGAWQFTDSNTGGTKFYRSYGF